MGISCSRWESVFMGATPDQVLSIAVLTAFHVLWLQHPGTYDVRRTDDDILSAFPQIVLKAFAADLRDGHSVLSHPVEGDLAGPDGIAKPITMRDVLNKIIHGKPARIDVLETGIWLTFSNVLP